MSETVKRCVAIALLVASCFACSSQVQHNPSVGNETLLQKINRDEVLALVLGETTRQFETAVTLEVNDYKTDGEWAYVTATPRDAQRQAINYATTRFANDYAEGFFDDWLCALVRQDHRGIRIIAYELGATDAPFVDWPKNYGVPEELISH